MAIEITFESFARARPQETLAYGRAPELLCSFRPHPFHDFDFGVCLRDGRAVISAVARASFQTATRSSSRSPTAVAPGCERFSAPIFVLVTSTRSLFIPKHTTTRGYRGLSTRMICTSITQRHVGGGACEVNFWYRRVSSSGPESFC